MSKMDIKTGIYISSKVVDRFYKNLEWDDFTAKMMLLDIQQEILNEYMNVDETDNEQVENEL